MARVSGVILVLVGAGVAAYALVEPNGGSVDTGALGQRAADIAASVASPPVTSPATPQTQPSPSAQLLPLADHTGKAALPAVAAPLPARSARRRRGERVVIAKGATRTPVGRSSGLNEPPLGQAALARELQRQLHRVGCYAGSASGVWGPSTRRAMKAFTDQANATLPIDKPDTILLAMVQNHDGKACGVACPAGERRADGGRCLPNAIAARSARPRPGTYAPAGKAPAAVAPDVADGNAPAATAEAPADPGVPIPGRMALAGPGAEVQPDPASSDAVQRPGEARKTAARRKARTTKSAKYAPSSRRRMGAWIFHDAPVDRVLAR